MWRREKSVCVWGGGALPALRGRDIPDRNLKYNSEKPTNYYS